MVDKRINVYTDGSYNNNTPDVAYGAYYIEELGKQECFKVSVQEAKESRNITGEILGAIMGTNEVVVYANEHSDENVKLYLLYDYEGVGKWLTGEWKAKKALTRTYVKSMKEILTGVKNIEFHLVWVKGHGNIDGNCKADGLARNAINDSKCIDMTQIFEELIAIERR